VPSKLYDAMAVGRPALVAATGEAAALTRASGCGVVVPPEDGEALAEAILELKAHPDEASAMAARGRVAAREHARSRQIERLEQVLKQAAAR
jgi:glycosyltransferase involved in cell wall biosynthesis